MNPEHGIPVSPRLTCHPDKQRLYGADTYYQESHEQLAALTGDVTGFAHRHAALLLKPDAVVARRLEAAVDWLTEQRYRIVGAAVTRLSRTMIRSLWYFQWNLATPHRRRLAALFLEDADALVLLVRPEREPYVPASVELTRLKGPTDPDARRPGQLRHLLGRYSYLLNLVHTPDEPADVLRELAVHFDDATREELFRTALAGEDRTAHALELAGRLYADTKPRDLHFDPAAERLRDTVTRHLGALPDASPRTLLETAWDQGLELDPWDAVIVGSSVLPMRVPGRAPVLDGAGTDTWRRHLDVLNARPN
ncbi:nucleoside-diphosphate kinase [Streptomyces sp. GXMU-J15]|uniref:Nucleoside-diphosphate kinase n=1 Tax=Streptomyces fuscus TaxID=3048495 RepID=A0ABT7J4M1_9ACTN|nr:MULTISPECIES: nucleoside-diphosphate kinase [Streptomyces]MDL2079804.1 nucleoside-diphosphate kinase [Streptomyces fuscus]SBT91742.1 nucleoside diphosphate kinase [Streptomyces sp. DI166]